MPHLHYRFQLAYRFRQMFSPLQKKKISAAPETRLILHIGF